MRIAMLGTRGVPARYGGFETCVEQVGSRLAANGHQVTVYCRLPTGAPGESLDRPRYHRGMDLVHLPAAPRRSLETLSHTSLSVGHLLGRPADVALVFNAGNAPLLPGLRARRIPVATHVDGLEWKRAKWNGVGRAYYRAAEALAVRWSDALIADASGIQDYYRREFGAESELIVYGAPLLGDPRPELLAPLGLSTQGYHLVVARFEPENHVDMIVSGYCASAARQPLVVVGSAPYAQAYTARVHAAADHRVRFLGGIWDQELLDQLYANATTYLHGHSVGGTNPSLLRAIGAGAAVNAYDVGFNREVLADAGLYFSTGVEVASLVEAAERGSDDVRLRGKASLERAELYDWDEVAGRYEQLCRRLADGPRGGRPSGRRTRSASAHPGAALPAAASVAALRGAART